MRQRYAARDRADHCRSFIACYEEYLANPDIEYRAAQGFRALIQKHEENWAIYDAWAREWDEYA